jgi:RNA polymerase sigma-70 factor (ECF subfamily)
MHDGEMSDSDLMCLFYRGDDRAFDALTARWRSRMVRFFRFHSGFGREEAEDLTQDVFVKLYVTRETMSFDLSQPLEPFLYTVARNLAIQEWRKRRPKCVPIDWIEELDLKEDPSALSQATLDDLFLCIWNLPEPERFYLLLCEKHGLGDCTHIEIARLLGKSPALLTRISQRALTHLREQMMERGYR